MASTERTAGGEHHAAEDDLAGMRRALAAAATARLATSPRPWVGAYLTPGGFDGATDGQAGPHAEVVALDRAGSLARGSTLYVTLEPCSHWGRTPPCADAAIAAGVRRVVVGTVDPDPKVAGEGIERLRAAGIEVTVGVARAEVEEQLAAYLHHRRTGRPYVVLKLAASLDGRTGAPDGTSQWITGPEARADAHRLRAESDAVIVGAATVRADDPALTVRALPDAVASLPRKGQPRRVVLGRAPAGAKVRPCLEWEGNPEALLDRLGAEDVVQVLLEGGARVAGDWHRRGLVDRYVVYLAPALFGGDDATPVLAGPGATTMAELWRGRLLAATRVGQDLRVELAPPG